MRAEAVEQRRPAVGIVGWASVLEDFLEPIGISLDEFCTAFRGSWIFGYAAALEHAGMRPVLLFTSKSVQAPRQTEHAPTGATVWLLPAPHVYRALARRMVYPYGESVEHMFGRITGPRRALLPVYGIAQALARYLATPPLALLHALEAERCAALICQEYESARFDVCVLLGRLTRRRVFGCFQGGNYHHSSVERFVRPIAIRASAGIIAGPEYEAQRVLGTYAVAPDRVERIFNPVDTSIWKPVDREPARAELGIPSDARVVAWHGRVAMHKKGLDVLAEAWQALREGGCDRRLLLVGTGDDDVELERRLGTSRRDGVVWIRRFVHDPTVLRRYLSAADVYAFPSRYEGFPVAPLEALACALPVVAADAEGIAEILVGGERSGGVVVPRDDASALASAVGALLGDDDRRRELSRQARRNVETRFSLEATGERLRRFLGVGV